MSRLRFKAGIFKNALKVILNAFPENIGVNPALLKYMNGLLNKLCAFVKSQACIYFRFVTFKNIAIALIV